MANRKLKKIMTDLAAGHITKKDADNLMKMKRVAQSKPKQEIKGDHIELNKKEDKKSHKNI